MADRLFNSQVDIRVQTAEDMFGIGGAEDVFGIGGGAVFSIEDTPLTSNTSLLVTRELNSSSDATTTTTSIDAQVTRELNSAVNVTTDTQSDASVERQLSSVVNKVFSGISDIQATRAFNSIADLTTSTTDIDLLKENLFLSASNIATTTTAPAIQSIRMLDSAANITTDTQSSAEIFNSFSSAVNITTAIEDLAADYKIAGIKKLEYLTNHFTPDHYQYFYPKFRDLIRTFLRFLDYNSIYKTLTLTNNNNLNTIFPEFINYYLDQFLNNVIDLDKYGLTNRNKQLFVMISRLLLNSKGNQQSFDYLFRSLTNIQIANEDNPIDIDKIITEFIEDESWWSGANPLYYDGTYNYDGAINHDATFNRPFTYQFKIDQNRKTMIPLIRAVHPAGFQQEFLIEMDFEDDASFNDVAQTTTTYFHYYNYGEPNATGYLYDGSITYSGSHDEVLTY